MVSIYVTTMSRFSLFSTHYNKQVGSLYVFRAQSSPRTCIFHNVRRYASHTSCARTSPGLLKHSRKLTFSSMNTSRATQPFGTVSNAASQSRSAGTTINPFEQLGLHKGLVHGLGELGIVEPTNVQLKAIPAILKGKTVVCASETGSGKTLAFLLPVLQKLKVQELEAVANGEKFETLLNRPRAIVLVPTRELVVQTLQVLKRLSHQGKFRAEGLINTNARSKYPERPIDILVSTPSKLLEFRNSGKVFTSKVSVVIIDEADTIVSQGFDVETEELLGPLLDRRPSKKGRAAMDPAQLVFVGATILVQEVGYKGRGRDLIRSPITWLEEQGIDSQSIQVVRSDSVNNIPDQLVLETQHAGRSGKMTALLDTLRQIRQQKGRKSKTLIFCNDVAATRAVAHAIDDSMESNNTNPEEFSWDEDEFRTLSLHKMLPRKQRNEAVNAFTNPDTEHDIMVCTDLASRGLNFDESVETVINFDVPSSFTDFMHRIGRTARAGKPGRVVSIVTTRAEQQELEDRIRNARENSVRIQSSPIRGSGGNFVSQYARLQQIDNKSKGTEQSSSAKGPKRSHGRDRLNRSRKAYFDSQQANRRSPGNKLPQSRSTGQTKHDTTANRRSSGKKLPRSYSIGQTKHDTTERSARSWTNRSSHNDKWWK